MWSTGSSEATEGMVECAVGEMVLVGKGEVRILGGSPRCGSQRIIFEQVVGIERQDASSPSWLPPGYPDDADVVDGVDHADERTFAARASQQQPVAHRTVAG